jgi:transposase
VSNRNFSYEFRLGVVRRIEQGESISKLYHELGIRRSVLYRWWDVYRQEGAAGLNRPIGRPPGVPNATTAEPSIRTEEALRQQIAELERKVGQQTVQLDFFKRAFRRVKESRQRTAGAGATASTGRSGK